MKVMIISLCKTTWRGDGATVGMNNEPMNDGTYLSLQTCKGRKMKDGGKSKAQS